MRASSRSARTVTQRNPVLKKIKKSKIKIYAVFFACVHIHGCVNVFGIYECYMVCVGVHVYEARRAVQYCAVTVCIIPLRQGLPLILELGWHPANHSDPLVSISGSTRVRDEFVVLPSFVYECWGLELRSSGLCSKFSSLPTIFPGPVNAHMQPMKQIP